MTTTTTNFESIAAVDLDDILGGCKRGGMQQAAFRPPPPGGGGDDGPIDVAVDYNSGQTQTQTA